MRINGKLLLLPVCVFAISAFDASGTTPKSNTNVVQNIETESMGNVVIDIPDVVLHQILVDDYKAPAKINNVRKKEVTPKSGVYQTDGYRVQVFSEGGNQGALASKAKARGSAIVARFPQYRGQVYQISSAPNYYTRIGNFESQAEANKAMADFRRAFPQYAGQMRVVKCRITVKH